jgi:hypothetical protein
MRLKQMRWPKKREFLAFYIISERYAGTTVEYAELISYLSSRASMSIKVSRNIIKRLLSIGYIHRVEGGLRVREINDVLDEAFFNMIAKRIKRVMKKRDQR